MRNHTIFAITFLVFSIGIFGYSNGAVTGQAFTDNFYTGPVTTYAHRAALSDDHAITGSGLRVRSMLDEEKVKLDKSTVQLCVERALKFSNRISYDGARYYFNFVGVCDSIDPEDLDLDNDGWISRKDVSVANSLFSFSGLNLAQKNKINNYILCGESNAGKTLWFSMYGEHRTCTNLKHEDGFEFLNFDVYAYY